MTFRNQCGPVQRHVCNQTCKSGPSDCLTTSVQAHSRDHPPIASYHKPALGADDATGCVHSPHGDPLFGASLDAGDVGAPRPRYPAFKLSLPFDGVVASYSAPPGAACRRLAAPPSCLLGTPLAVPTKLAAGSGAKPGTVDAPGFPSPMELKPIPGSPRPDHGPELSTAGSCWCQACCCCCCCCCCCRQASCCCCCCCCCQVSCCCHVSCCHVSCWCCCAASEARIVSIDEGLASATLGS